MGLFSFFKLDIDKLEKNKDIKKLLKLWNHNDRTIRRKATSALKRVGRPATEQIIQLLKHRHPHVRIEAVDVLNEFADARALDPLLDALQDADKVVRFQAALALGKIKDQKVLVPLANLANQDRDAFVRQCAVESLGKKNDAAVIPWLTRILEMDKDYYVRGEARRALESIGDSVEGIPNIFSLIQALDYENDLAKSRAKKELIKLGKGAVKKLTESLNHKNRWVRRDICDILGEIGDRQSINYIKKMLMDSDNDVRYSAAEALTKLNWEPWDDQQKVQHLVATEQWQKLINFGKAGTETLLASFEYIQHRDLEREIVKILGELSDQRAVPRLLQFFEKGWNQNRHDYETFLEIVTAFGKIGDPQAIEEILKGLFLFPQEINCLNYNIFKKALLNLVPTSTLSEELVELILQASGVTYLKGSSLYRSYDVEFSLEDSNNAVEALCAQNSTLTSNFLHLIADKKDVIHRTEREEWDGGLFVGTKTFSCQAQREKASEELKRRHNPPYQPDAYIPSKIYKNIEESNKG